MTGLSKKFVSIKVGVCVYFELGKDQLVKVKQHEKN